MCHLDIKYLCTSTLNFVYTHVSVLSIQGFIWSECIKGGIYPPPETVHPPPPNEYQQL